MRGAATNLLQVERLDNDRNHYISSRITFAPALLRAHTSSGFTRNQDTIQNVLSGDPWKNSLSRLTKVVVMLQQRRFEDLCAALERYGKLDVAYWVCAFSATCAQHFSLLQ